MDGVGPPGVRSAAALGGVAGAVVMMASLYAGRALGLLDADFARYQGCLVLRRGGGAAEPVGWAFHLANGAALGLGYAEVFERTGGAGWRRGAALGVAHGVAAGAALPLLDAANPCVQEGRMPAFGPFGKHSGPLMVAGFLVGHVVYGAIVGAACGHARTDTLQTGGESWRRSR